MPELSDFVVVNGGLFVGFVWFGWWWRWWCVLVVVVVL